MNGTDLESQPSDLLLAWLSARGKVSRPTLDRTCLAIANRFNLPVSEGRSPTYRYVAPLRRIGHVEEVVGRFVVVPPALCWTARHDRGVFIGARDNSLCDELHRRLSPCFHTSHPDAPWPATWELTGDRETISLTLAGLGIAVVDEPGMRLLASLPTLEDAIAAWPETDPPSMDSAWDVAADPVRGRWISAGRVFVEDGLVRCRDRKPHRWRIERRGAWRPVDSHEKRSVAWWAELARLKRPRIVFNRENCRLVLPASYLPPPLMVERPLIWASGEPPGRDLNQRWIYEAIDSERAGEVARILGLEREDTS